MKKLAKNLKNPLVSVVMPVYNAGPFLVEAIESILGQTYKNFEFIIVDDGSTDNSWEIIKNYAKKDKRIRAFQIPKNSGVSNAANLGTSKAKGWFIARMDADDVSLPYRLEKQVEFLKKNPQVVAVGGQCLVINKEGNLAGNKTFPIEPEKLKEMIFWAIPIQQPTLMVNRSLLPKDFGWYSPTCTSGEEVDLLFRLMKYGQIVNLKDRLLFYRYRKDSLSHQNFKKTFWLTLKSRVGAIRLGFLPTPKAILLNLAQIIGALLLPNKLLSTVWYFLRGIREVGELRRIEETWQIKSFGKLGVLGN